MHNTTDEGWDQESLMLSRLFCMHKIIDEGWDPYRLVILAIKSLL